MSTGLLYIEGVEPRINVNFRELFPVTVSVLLFLFFASPRLCVKLFFLYFLFFLFCLSVCVVHSVVHFFLFRGNKYPATFSQHFIDKIPTYGFTEMNHSISSSFTRKAQRSEISSITFEVGFPEPCPAFVSMRISTGLSPALHS